MFLLRAFETFLFHNLFKLIKHFTSKRKFDNYLSMLEMLVDLTASWMRTSRQWRPELALACRLQCFSRLSIKSIHWAAQRGKRRRRKMFSFIIGRRSFMLEGKEERGEMMTRRELDDWTLSLPFLKIIGLNWTMKKTNGLAIVGWIESVTESCWVF